MCACVQGLGDEEIPPERALELSDAISSRDVIVTYVKYGKHGNTLSRALALSTSHSLARTFSLALALFLPKLYASSFVENVLVGL